MSAPTSDVSTKVISWVAIAFSIVFVTIYLVSAWKLADAFALNAPGEGMSWDRAWSIFSGIQSAGMSAIGVLLGVAVQQPRVADAKAEAGKAKGAIAAVLSPNEKGGGASGSTTVLSERDRQTLLNGMV